MSDEKKEQVRALFAELKNSEEVSRQTGVAKTTVRRWCKDLCNEQRELVDGKLNDRRAKIAVLLEANQVAGHVDLAVYTQQLGMDEAAIRKMMRGSHCTYINSNVKQGPAKLTEKQKAIELYHKGMSYKAISKELGVARSSISIWLRDINENSYQLGPRQDNTELKKKARDLYTSGMTALQVAKTLSIGDRRVGEWCHDLVIARKKNKPLPEKFVKAPRLRKVRVLSDEQVVEMRNDVRDTGVKNWRVYSERYNASIGVISAAMRGETFRHLNGVSAPIEKNTVKPVRPKTQVWKKPRPAEEFVTQIVAMRREDPVTWTYVALAQWMQEKTGRKYRANHIAILVTNRDPSLAQIKDTVVPKPKPKKERVVAPLMPWEIRAKAFELKQRRAKKQMEEKAAIDRMIAEEDAREEALRLLALARDQDLNAVAAEFV